MHLYFNKEGKLTTVIPHGEIPRQGSYLNLYVLLDEDFFDAKSEDYLDWSVNVEIIYPNGKISVPFISDDVPQLVSFEKMSDSEVTFDLEDGREYLTYVFKFNEEQATNYAGKIEALVSIVKTNGSVLEDLSYFGKADIYIEKTFGYAQKFIDASSEHYKNLINLVNDLNNKKLNVSQLEAELTKLDIVNKNEVIRLIKKYAGTSSGGGGGGNLIFEIGTSDFYDENSDEQVSSVKLVIKLIEEKAVPKRLNLLPDVDKFKTRDKIYLYADENGTSKKISIRNLLDTKIRTVTDVPIDLQHNEYIFKEIK